MRTALTFCAFSLCLGACASNPAPRHVTSDVVVPAPVACRPNIEPSPIWPDTDEALIAGPDLFARVRLLLAGRLLRMARERELLAALEGCRG